MTASSGKKAQWRQMGSCLCLMNSRTLLCSAVLSYLKPSYQNNQTPDWETEWPAMQELTCFLIRLENTALMWILSFSTLPHAFFLYELNLELMLILPPKKDFFGGNKNAHKKTNKQKTYISISFFILLSTFTFAVPVPLLAASSPHRYVCFHAARSKSMVLGELSRLSRPCSPLDQEKALKSGWLKRQRSIMKNWQLRWFVLKSEALYFYKDQDETKAQVWQT